MLRRGGTYYVETHDWPVGIGTESEKLPRSERYAILASLFTEGEVEVAAIDQQPQPNDQQQIPLPEAE